MLPHEGMLPVDLFSFSHFFLRSLKAVGMWSKVAAVGNAEHGRRVAHGKRSIIFGLQSFGEGIDLPGPLCEHVVIRSNDERSARWS
ncbi:MAG: hypothetical protein EOP82_14260 [Variovorax sp.]|nr:MAG: hypothetical protein EOP82_14260 [Variovorax sp.]